ncbi:LIM and SH3 domain protein Lasp, partial [Eumeta japonica]
MVLTDELCYFIGLCLASAVLLSPDVADDPETLRIKQNTKIISNVAYHGDLEKKAAMEKQRGAAEASDNLK